MTLNDGALNHSPNHTIDKYADTLTQLGCQIVMRDEIMYPIRFFDVGAIIFYAKACVWEVPDFSVQTHFDKLRKYQEEIDAKEFVQTTGHRFLLASRKM